MRKIIIILLFIISSCCNGLSNNNLYIPIQDYTEQEQKELADFLEKNNVEIMDKVIVDYGELRERVRVVNGD